MKIVHSIALDFGRDTLPITIFAKQYDKESRFIEIVPLDCGKEYELESGVTARLQLTKPDGYTVLNTATIADGIIKVELTEQTLITAGTAVAEIGLYKGDALLSSQIFHIDIKKAAYNPNAPTSSDEYPALIEDIGKIAIIESTLLNKAEPTAQSGYVWTATDNGATWKAQQSGANEIWELIEEINTDTITRNIGRNETPIGREYNFKKVRILWTNPESAGTGSANAYITAKITSNLYALEYILLKYTNCFYSAEVDNTFLNVKSVCGSGEFECTVKESSIINTTHGNITEIAINGNSDIVIGTNIKIYGVWA